jgi:hypothetical protein
LVLVEIRMLSANVFLEKVVTMNHGFHVDIGIQGLFIDFVIFLLHRKVFILEFPYNLHYLVVLVKVLSHLLDVVIVTCKLLFVFFLLIGVIVLNFGRSSGREGRSVAASVLITIGQA